MSVINTSKFIASESYATGKVLNKNYSDDLNNFSVIFGISNRDITTPKASNTAIVSGSEPLIPINAGTESRVSFQAVAIVSDGKMKLFTAKDLQAIQPMLQKADLDQDGIVTRTELENYQEILKHQRMELSHGQNARLVMDILTNIRLIQGSQKAITKIDQQIDQIGTLFNKDQGGRDLFSKLTKTLGSGGGLSLQKVNSAIATLCPPTSAFV